MATIKIPDNWQKIIGQGGMVAALTALFTFMINVQTEYRSDYKAIIDRLEQQIERQEIRITELEKVNDDLRKRISIISSMTYNSPIASWFKDLQGRMVMVNDTYEQLFLIPNGKNKFDYIGQTDEEFWGSIGKAEIGKKYREHDIRVMTEKQTIRYTEIVYVGNSQLDLIVYKYPVYSTVPEFANRQIIGVGGVAVVIHD